MRLLLAVTLLATMAAAQQQPKTFCFEAQLQNGTVRKGSNQPPSDSSKSALSTSSPASCERSQTTADFHQQIQLRDQAAFTLAPAVTRTAVGSNYVPPPQLTPLHQTSDDFSSTAGFQLGAAMSREIQVRKAKAFAKKFCKSYGSGAAWSYQFSSGNSIEGVCE